MIPQVEDVFELARYHLGDTEVPGGQWAQNNYLQPFFGASYQSVFRWLQRNHAQLLRRSSYFNLPANTSYLKPADAGIANLGQPEDIFDRKVGATLSATVATLNVGVPGQTISSVDLTCTAHGLSAGAQVLTFGFAGLASASTDITDDVNDLWTISVPDANTIRLNGCAAFGNTGATGIVSTGGEQWPACPLTRRYDLTPEFQNSVSSGQLSLWCWHLGVLRFVPASEVRQIKIIYDLSGTAPTSGSIGLNDSLEALAMLTAARAAKPKFGNNADVQDMFVKAVGNPEGDTSRVTGGFLAELAQIETQGLTKVPIIMQPFRRKRNSGLGRW